MKANTKRTDILEKPMWRLLVQLSIPGVLGMSVNAINMFVDTIFIGQLVGQAAVAGIGLAFPMLMITNAVTSLIGMGASSVLSRAIGAEDHETESKIFGTVLTLSLIVSGILTVVTYIYAPQLIAFLGGEGEVLELGVTYYRIVMLGAFARIFGVASSMIIRAEGKIKEAMTFMIIATLFNMILDPIFISYFDMGLAGAAWATVVAMLLLSLFNVIYFASGNASYQVNLRYLGIERQIMRPLLAVGLSAMFLQIMFFIQQAVVFKSIEYYGGSRDQAFMTAVYRVVILVVMPMFGFVQSMQPVTGINYGAGRVDRVKEGFRVFLLAGTVFLTFIWLSVQVYPQVVLGWILPDMDLNSDDLFRFRMMLMTLPSLAFFFLTVTMYQSLGKGRPATALLVARDAGLFTPVVLILPLFFGIQGIYFAMPVTDVFMVFMTIFLLNRLFRSEGFQTKPTEA
ncbi:MAG: MATE family efflux transporter [Bacteroidota bacterium]